MAILRPQAVPQAIPFESLSKREIADIVNKQAKDIQAAVQEKLGLMSLLCAIVKHPDAFKMNEDGEATLEVAAIEELKENTQLKTNRVGDQLVLKVRESTYLLHAETGHLGMKIHDIH